MQHELAWHLRERHPELGIRLEYPHPCAPRGALDLLIRFDQKEIALELKYLCCRMSYTDNDEVFNLKNQSAQDLRRYGVLKDVMRMEKFCEAHPKAKAGVLVLTNDQSFWKGPNSEIVSSAEFSIRDGRRVSGELQWKPNAVVSRVRGYDKPIKLLGTYDLFWQDYSTVSVKNGRFRFLYIPVSAVSTLEPLAAECSFLASQAQDNICQDIAVIGQ